MLGRAAARLFRPARALSKRGVDKSDCCSHCLPAAFLPPAPARNPNAQDRQKARLDTRQRGVQSERGAVDGGSII